MKVLRISGSPPHLVSLIIFQPFISPPSFSSLWQANPFEAASTFYTIESLFLPVRRPRNGHTYSHTRLSFSALYSGPPKSQHVPFCCSYRQPAVSTNSSTHPKYALFSSEQSAHTGWDAVTHGPKCSSVLCMCVCVCVCDVSPSHTHLSKTGNGKGCWPGFFSATKSSKSIFMV